MSSKSSSSIHRDAIAENAGGLAVAENAEGPGPKRKSRPASTMRLSVIGPKVMETFPEKPPRSIPTLMVAESPSLNGPPPVTIRPRQNSHAVQVAIFDLVHGLLSSSSLGGVLVPRPAENAGTGLSGKMAGRAFRIGREIRGINRRMTPRRSDSPPCLSFCGRTAFVRICPSRGREPQEGIQVVTSRPAHRSARLPALVFRPRAWRTGCLRTWT
jgi:hypothetical protein